MGQKGPEVNCRGRSAHEQLRRVLACSPRSSTCDARRATSRSIWVFLGCGCFVLKTPSQGGWKSLDFLGFSRPNLDLSMGYERFSRIIFRRAFSRTSRSPRRAPVVVDWQKRWNYTWSKPRLVSDFLQGTVHWRPTPSPHEGTPFSPREKGEASSAARRPAPGGGEPVRPTQLEPVERAIAEAAQGRDVVGEQHEPERQHP